MIIMMIMIMNIVIRNWRSCTASRGAGRAATPSPQRDESSY